MATAKVITQADRVSLGNIDRHVAIETQINKIDSIAGLILGAGQNAEGEFDEEITWGAVWIREATKDLRELLRIGSSDAKEGAA